MNEIREKRNTQINWNTREKWYTLKRNSEFLNKQIKGMIDELELNRENWQGSKGQALAELQLKYMKLQADALNLRIADIEGEME